jgi:hypothetical protein
MRKHLLTLAATSVAALSFASTASADGCLGLECPGDTSAKAPAAAQIQPLVPIAESPRALESVTTSGYYDFGTNGPTHARAVAYVAVPGEWESAPAEVKALPASQTLTAPERATNRIVVFGPRVLVTVASPTATAAAKKDKTGPKARAAAAADCPSGYFCLFDGGTFTDGMGRWSDVGIWQNLSNWGWQGRGSSMVNRRNGYTLLERSDNARYCAIPNSEDANLGNNGYNNNTGRVYLSASTSRNSAWGCTN